MDECCETKLSGLIALANDLREIQDRTNITLEHILGPQPVSESDAAKPSGTLDELQILFAGISRNAKDILTQVNRINNAI